jgi:hypothetical protein
MAEAMKLPTKQEANTPIDQLPEQIPGTEKVENSDERGNSISSLPATEEISKEQKKDDGVVSELESRDVASTDEEGRRGKYITGLRFYMMVLSYVPFPPPFPPILSPKTFGGGLKEVC